MPKKIAGTEVSPRQLRNRKGVKPPFQFALLVIFLPVGHGERLLSSPLCVKYVITRILAAFPAAYGESELDGLAGSTKMGSAGVLSGDIGVFRYLSVGIGCSGKNCMSFRKKPS